MNKNFAEKFSTVENIVFLIFLFAFPTAFYLYNYSACAALGLEREAFYFCLELVVLFGLLFIIFSCFPHHFVRPMLTKNIFFVFSIIFIPWICYYANATYFYAPYRGILLYGIILTGSLCLFMPNVREVQANAKEKFTILDNVFAIYILLCPLPIAAFYYPFFYDRFLFVFVYSIAVYNYFLHAIFTCFKFFIPHFTIINKIYILFLFAFIPLFSLYGIRTNQFTKFGMIASLILFIIILIFNYLQSRLTKNEEGLPIPKPQPPNED